MVKIWLTSEMIEAVQLQMSTRVGDFGQNRVIEPIWVELLTISGSSESQSWKTNAEGDNGA